MTIKEGERLPDATLQELPVEYIPSIQLPSAHYPMEEAPDETYQALYDFFKKEEA